RGFLSKLPAVVPSAFNGPQLVHLLGGDSGPADWDRDLTRIGITHLLLSAPEIDRLQKKVGYLALPPPQADKFRHWIHGLPRVFDDGRGTMIVALHSAPGDA